MNPDETAPPEAPATIPAPPPSEMELTEADFLPDLRRLTDLYISPQFALDDAALDEE